jgi:predicted nucleic acid-binding protein
MAPRASSPLVIDASVAVKWLLTETHSAESLELLKSSPLLHVPDLLFPEVGNILWKCVRRGDISTENAQELVQWLLLLPLQVHPSSSLLPVALEIACRYDRSVYDSLYLALAIREGCAVVTADERLVNALSATPIASSLLLLGS